MKIAFAIPVHNDHVELVTSTFLKWRTKGYTTAAFMNSSTSGRALRPENCNLVIRGNYNGWASAVNALCECPYLKDFDWIVTGGADQFPDPDKPAHVLGYECLAHFQGTFGVMQPRGDCWGALVDKSAAVSPWMGKAWRHRINGGKGPLWQHYRHFWADTELAAVATKLGVMWWRDDVSQYHDHYLRRGEGVPAHLQKVAELSNADRALFEARRSQGFPKYEPIPDSEA